MKRVFVGFDRREASAYRVCVESLACRARESTLIQPISSYILGSWYWRAEERKGDVRWDVISNAPMATEFSIARFFVPLMQRTGIALFCDGDFMFRYPVEDLFALADPRYAIQVVKHQHSPVETIKMDGQPQTAYARKNWSSLMLFNCAHPANQALTLDYLNSARGLDLHQFAWLHSDQIGELPCEWNWLEGSSSASIEPKAVHFTRGTPDMKGYENVPYAEEWKSYARRTA